jgi:hypothetical protein
MWNFLPGREDYSSSGHNNAHSFTDGHPNGGGTLDKYSSSTHAYYNPADHQHCGACCVANANRDDHTPTTAKSPARLAAIFTGILARG